MPRRKCTFNEDLRAKFTSFKKGKYDWEVCCSICNCTISIANKGRRDIEDHVKSEKHSKNLRASTSSAALDSFVVRRPAADQKHLKAAEATIAYHTIFHHQSFNSLDCTIKLNQKIYFDSNICKQLSCARTKATAIITNVIAPFSISQVLCDLKTIAFISVQTDASNHLALKIFPVLIRYYDFKNGGTKSKILNLAFEKNEKSDTITQLIVETLTKNNLLTKCIGFCADNCNTNFGGRQRKGSNNVYSKLKLLVNQNMISVGCPPHVLNNAIFHGCDTLPVDVDKIIVKIYNYFSIYTVRTERLRDFAEFLDNEYKPLLYHSKTRWLSLYPAVERLLLMFEILKSYFEEVENPPKILIEFFKDDLSEAYLFLVHSLMSIFNFNIQKLEKQDISIIETVNVLQNIVSNIQERINSNFIPIKIKSIMKKLVESGLQEKVNKFKIGTNNLYNITVKYIESWLKPFEEFKVFSWMQFNDKNVTWESVEPCLIYIQEKGVNVGDSALFDQFCNLKHYMDNLSPCDETNVNTKWTEFFKSCTSIELYSELIKIAEFYFAIPSHNADVERVFSLINSQWTKERNKLVPDTVKGIILTKFNFQALSCESFYDSLMSSDGEILNKIRSNEKYN
ncbi:uncharacterized protein LOC129940426 [Eupeodes corollae]|uniref:uncharacterized protein LOC129940426 n=1 Tax=Eupeodes corollae TaxID=290404 RepID=UPI0024909692|nr:uncharacterized protein LOC129940426 [Eupeodes corollae]